MKTIVTAVLALAGLCAGYTVWNRDPPLVAACEEAIIDRLKVPSSYERISVSTSTHEVTPEEATGKPWSKDPDVVALYADKLRMFQNGAYEHQAVFRYEAQNMLGVPIRRYITCTYYTTKPEISRPLSAFSVDLT